MQSSRRRQALLAHGAKVYIAGRSPEKIQDAVEELKGATGREAYPLVVDLADLKSIRTAVEQFNTYVNICLRFSCLKGADALFLPTVRRLSSMSCLIARA